MRAATAELEAKLHTDVSWLQEPHDAVELVAADVGELRQLAEGAQSGNVAGLMRCSGTCCETCRSTVMLASAPTAY